MAFGAPLRLCALVYAVADGYFRTYDEVRSLNADLERTLELERTHERLRALERSTTLAVERGGHADQGVAAMLRECIEDLRLMIDSLETGEDSLLVALVVEVEDDGHGFKRTAVSGAGRPAGRGLHNMELRARGGVLGW